MKNIYKCIIKILLISLLIGSLNFIFIRCTICITLPLLLFFYQAPILLFTGFNFADLFFCAVILLIPFFVFFSNWVYEVIFFVGITLFLWLGIFSFNHYSFQNFSEAMPAMICNVVLFLYILVQFVIKLKKNKNKLQLN